MQAKTLPRITVISDISGFGKCALTVAIPLINACGIEVVPVPTAVLSTNMKFPGFFRRDLGGDTGTYLNHYDQLGLVSDMYYTGFICSVEQANAVRSYLSGKDGTKLCDPIMGDNMKRYRGFDDGLCKSIAELCAVCDIVTPNPTEAFILAGEEITDDRSTDKMKELAERICAGGTAAAVITGAERGASLFNCIYDKKGYRELVTERLPFGMSGTGDMFASLLSAYLTLGFSIDESVSKAQDYISFIMRESRKYEDCDKRGPCFEPYLQMLGRKV